VCFPPNTTHATHATKFNERKQVRYAGLLYCTHQRNKRKKNMQQTQRTQLTQRPRRKDRSGCCVSCVCWVCCVAYVACDALDVNEFVHHWSGSARAAAVQRAIGLQVPLASAQHLFSIHWTSRNGGCGACDCLRRQRCSRFYDRQIISFKKLGRFISQEIHIANIVSQSLLGSVSISRGVAIKLVVRIGVLKVIWSLCVGLFEWTLR